MKWSAPFKLSSIFGLCLMAQMVSADVLPGPAMPETVSRALSKQTPVQQPSGAAAVINRPKPEAGELGEAAKKIKFQLNGMIIEGNTVYTADELRPLYADKLHQTISVAELFSIVQGITNYYRNSGYILTRAILPPQHVKGGVVRIRIIEGYIGDVVVSGKPRGSECIVHAFGERIAACRPLLLSRMEKYMLLANEIPGTEVKAVLSPSKTNVGAADLNLVTQNNPAFGFFSYDNYGTRYIGPQQMTGNVGLNSFAASGDSGQVTFTKTPKGGELTYIDINYNMPLWADGIRWLVGGTRAHTHPLFVLQPQQIDGLNDNYYTTVFYPIIRSRSESLNLRTGFNYQDSRVTTIGDAELYTDHLRSLDLGFTYNFSDKYYGVNLISSDFRQGLPILGYTSNTNPDTALTSRPGGRGDYTKIMLTLSRLQLIRGPVSAYGVFNGQWAFNPLLASEQFTFGGSQIGRGYDVAELIGDKGVDGSLELRYDTAPAKLWMQSMQFYVFYDAGIVWNFKEIGGTPTKVSGTSTGVGVRFFFQKYISGNLMWTQTLTKQVAAEELIGEGKRPRVFFSLVAAFN